MTFLKKGPEPKKAWIFRPVFLLIIWSLLAALLVINGIYETKRLEDNLFRMLSDEGVAVIGGMEKSTQSIFSSLAAMEAFPEASAFLSSSPVNLLGLEESVVTFILEVAFQMDRQLEDLPFGEEELRKVAESWPFSLVRWVTSSQTLTYQQKTTQEPLDDSFYRPLLAGKASYAIQRSEEKKTGQINHLSVAILRKRGEGILILTAKEPEVRQFRRMVLLQGIVEEWEGKGDLQYISFQGEDGEIWAHSKPEKVGKKEDVEWVRGFFRPQSQPPSVQSQKRSKILEMAKLVHLDRNTRGVMRIGLSTDRVEQMIASDRRNVALFSLLLLLSGGAGLTFLSRMENRHLARMREMEEMVRQREKLSSLANLAAGVAHEIRNPLNAIGMAIQRLQREFIPASPGAQEEYFRFTEVLRGEVKRVNEIIEQFLFFARPARLNLQEVQIGEILQDLLLLCREAAEQQKVRLVENIPADLPPLKLDRQRIREALWNLLSNALQAMPQGGRLELTAEVHREARELVIKIWDSGEGIPEENLGKIFDYYFTTKEKGMGLGLPLAHKIIREHGGAIEVRSSVGKGTVFLVTLPVSQEEG